MRGRGVGQVPVGRRGPLGWLVGLPFGLLAVVLGLVGRLLGWSWGGVPVGAVLVPAVVVLTLRLGGL
jgi:hypothetical protein